MFLVGYKPQTVPSVRERTNLSPVLSVTEWKSFGLYPLLTKEIGILFTIG